MGSESQQEWNGRGHFFAAAAEAMRRILVENARRKGRLKRGGDRQRVELDVGLAELSARPEHVLAVDEALDGLAAKGRPLSGSRQIALLRWLEDRGSRRCARRIAPNRISGLGVCSCLACP